MARAQRLLQLREALQKALQRTVPAASAGSQALDFGDWRALVQAEAALSRALPALAREGEWSAAERQALAELRQAHEVARTRCEQALATLGTQLHEMGLQKEGWLAYAGMSATLQST
ncbi:MAG TPA: hypothetical protein VLA61_17990 [Ideonella sp.]|uniref:hypothetical protein n=1 Tax=Ideonella sp. TaxID=1929293 RepID=UPI002C3D39B4|nr:hypothetical protein [Ideonella sp.]HSI50167.1 hypothetical protein [Ideonella sp.]